MSGIAIQNATSGRRLPTHKLMRSWIAAVLPARLQNAELTVRIVEADEIRALNRDYRKKDKATNVLSFPAELPSDLGLKVLGDLVVCAQVVAEEAAQQGKTRNAHWAHMLVHGTLHLLGYDHLVDSDAERMEKLEIKILHTLGFANPYEEEK